MSGSQFISFIKKEFNNGTLLHTSIELWIADEDGDLDDDYPQPEADQVLSGMGLENFYLKITDADAQARLSIANSFRNSIAAMYVIFVFVFVFVFVFFSIFWILILFCCIVVLLFVWLKTKKKRGSGSSLPNIQDEEDIDDYVPDHVNLDPNSSMDVSLHQHSEDRPQGANGCCIIL